MRQLKIEKSITNREGESLERYFAEIARISLITADEEANLARKIREDDKHALDQLTKANLRFVVSVAKQHQNQGLSLPDLINEGNIGLIKAAKRFDETRGFKFISYAVWWIRQSIVAAISEQARMIRLPLNQIANYNKHYKVTSILEQINEREPTYSEIAKFMDLYESELTDLIRFSAEQIYLEEPYVHFTDECLLDRIPDENSISPEKVIMDQSLQDEIMRSLSTITEREREVVLLFFGIGIKDSLTFEQIGVKLDLTREQVRKVKDNAIKRLRHKVRNKLLIDYLCQ